MRDSAGAESRLEYQPNHYAVGLTLTANWVPQTFRKKVKAPPAVTDHPAEEWPGLWAVQEQRWNAALSLGDVDAAWNCWNSAAVEALGLQTGDRGQLKVKWAKSPELQRDATVTQDLQARHDLELAWYSVQEGTLPPTHWPSVAGPYLSTQESQKARLEEVRLKATKERQKSSKEGWEKFVKEAAENSIASSPRGRNFGSWGPPPDRWEGTYSDLRQLRALEGSGKGAPVARADSHKRTGDPLPPFRAARAVARPASGAALPAAPQGGCQGSGAKETHCPPPYDL
eukprot:1822946-Amphidinium_carterae.2